MTEDELRQMIYDELMERSRSEEYKFVYLVRQFEERHWRFEPDLENDIVDEIYRLAKNCSIRWHNNGFYIFNGAIYVNVKMDIVQSAFKIWLSRIGLKIPQRKKTEIFKNEFMEQIKIGNKLEPRLDIIAFKNGILDLNDMAFYPHNERFHVTYMHPYNYNKKAKCPMWQSFLHEVLPDKRSRMILQMFLGLGLIERGTIYNQYEGRDRPKIELCLILIGSGANGKSVIYQTAMGVFGQERISGADYDELTMYGDEGMRARRLLRDAIFNWSSDSDSRTFGRKRTGVFKRIVSGEPTTDRQIGGNVEQNYKMPYLIFNLNELPYPEDTTLGFIRRLQFISFDVTIPASRQNKTLASDLTREYSGIFNWILRGTREIKRRKFQFPNSEGSRRQLLLAQMRGNPVVAWVNAYRIRSIEGANREQSMYISAKDIMASLEQFCNDNDTPMVSQQKMGQTLSNMHFDKKRTQAGFEYRVFGVGLQDIFKPFIIRNESFEDRYEEDLDTCIETED